MGGKDLPPVKVRQVAIVMMPPSQLPRLRPAAQ